MPLDYLGTVEAGFGYGDSYPIYRVTIRRQRGDMAPVCFVAGLHGDERAGPLGVLEFLESIYPADASGTPCPVYPLVNPWGFENERRENGQGVDINRTFGELDQPTQEAAILNRDLDKIPFSFLHTLHEDNSRSGFYVYYTDDKRRWLAEECVRCAQGHFLPINSHHVAYDGIVKMYGGLVPYNFGLYPPPSMGCPLEDRWLKKGIHSITTETPIQAGLHNRVLCVARCMAITWEAK